MTGLIALVAPRAHAADGLGTWEGSGTTYNAQGGKLGTFALSLTRKQVGDDVRIDGAAVLADGRQFNFWEEDAKDGTSGYQVRSSNGSGHGGCFSNGVCQSYRQGDDGHALATTIVVDSPDQVRVTEVVFDKQQITQYREETLKRQP
jgi:hypothetical protein